MESRTETPAPVGGTPSLGVLPMEHYLAAAKDAELLKLTRAKDTATAKVRHWLKEEANAELAILQYIGQKYPARTEPEGAE